MLPTVRAILDLPVFREAAPRVLGGVDHLDNYIRWVHVSEVLDISRLLSGGELVLTTGLELEKQAGQTTSFIRSLEDAEAAGLVVELVGSRERSMAALEAAAQKTTLPVIILERRVRFVQITEIVHRMIVAEQLELVERTRDVHEAFTVLSLENAGTQQVVEQAAVMIGAPVVLEDLSHLVLSYSALGMSTTELLNDWERRSRITPSHDGTRRTGPEEWLQTPVGVRRQLWGRLVAPVAVHDDQPAAMILERAAQTLAINRLAERDQRELLHQAQAGLLNTLRQPRGLSEAEARARAAALGLKRAPYYLAVVFRSARTVAGAPTGTSGPPGDPLVGQQEERTLLEQLARALGSASGTALTASIQSGSVGMILGLSAKKLEDPMLLRITEAVAEAASAEVAAWIIGVGPPRDSLLEAAAGIDEAVHVAEAAATLRGARKPFYRGTDIRLRGLLSLLRNDPRVQLFVESELEGILRAEAQGDRGLLDLLGHYLESRGNKAAIARTEYLSRPTLYARLAKLEQLLSVDLDDAESQTSLHVALILHRLRTL
jgi:purine catabolism regulator